MVTLPPQFVATMYPGYFWNLETKTLFSIKVAGELRELKLLKKGWTPWGVYNEDCYQVSVQGENRYLAVSYLNTLQPGDSVIGIVTREQRFPFISRKGYRPRGYNRDLPN